MAGKEIRKAGVKEVMLDPFFLGIEKKIMNTKFLSIGKLQTLADNCLTGSSFVSLFLSDIST